MAGLMDFLSSDDAQLGLGLLAAGGPSATPMSLGQRLSAGVAQAQASKDAALRRQLLQSQIAENTSQDALRKAQLERQARQDAYYMGNGFAGTSSVAAPGAASGGLLGSGGPATAAPGTGAPGAAANPEAGSALKAAAGAPPNAPPPAQGKFAEWSKQYGIPVDALVADYFSNGGKGIADMLFKRGTPDMQVTNGYAYDKNKQQPGYLPQLNISSNGQATQVQIGPDGQPVVSAPQGAVGTFGAYQNAQGQAAANWQEGTPVYNAQGQKVIPSRADLLNSSRAPAVLPGRPLGATGPGYAGGSASAAAGGQAEILTAELQRATQEMAAAQQRGDAAGAARAQQDVAGIQRELQRLPGAARAAPAPLIGPGPSAGAGAGAGRGSMGMPNMPVVSASNVVELSPQEQAANKAFETAAVDRAKAGVVRETANAGDLKKSQQMQSAASQAMQLLNAGPTASGAGALADSGLNFVGQPTRSGNAAQQLEALSGWMVSNVPRMEGPQSDADVRNYAAMAGRVGDRTLPVEARKAALQTVIELQNKYSALNGGTAAAPAGAAAPAPLPAGWTVKVK